jgi:NAD+ kinase
MKKKKIGLFGSQFGKDFFPVFQSLSSKLVNSNCEIYIWHPFFGFLQKENLIPQGIKSTFTSPYDLPEGLDFMICIGGDGTFLEAVSIVRDTPVPLAGINSGRLGFLTDIAPDSVENAIDSIFHGKYIIEQRSLLEVGIENGAFPDFSGALNEVTIHKRDSASMINIHVWLDDLFLNKYWADGLIISTPTGSTAYSLSAGGPIIVPDANIFAITPIAPHNLTVRPIVVPDTRKIRLRVESRSSKFLVSLDHRSSVFDCETEITLRKSDYSIRLLRLSGNDFFSTLRGKLMWGADKRNL